MGLLIGHKLIYGHWPKTAGTWVTNVLREAGAGDLKWGRRLGYAHHDSPRVIPADERAGKEVAITVRDPWSWACSYYWHWYPQGGQQRYHLAQFDPDRDFARVIKAMFVPEQAAAFSDDVPFITPINPFRHKWEDIAAAGSLFQFFLDWYSTDGEREIADTYLVQSPQHDLTGQVEALLERQGYDTSPARNTGRTNESRRYQPEDRARLFTPDLVALIHDRTRPLCERFGWEPPDYWEQSWKEKG